MGGPEGRKGQRCRGKSEVQEYREGGEQERSVTAYIRQQGQGRKGASPLKTSGRKADVSWSAFHFSPCQQP